MQPFLASLPFITSFFGGPSRHLVHIGQANLRFGKVFVQEMMFSDKHGEEGGSSKNKIT